MFFPLLVSKEADHLKRFATVSSNEACELPASQLRRAYSAVDCQIRSAGGCLWNVSGLLPVSLPIGPLPVMFPCLPKRDNAECIYSITSCQSNCNRSVNANFFHYFPKGAVIIEFYGRNKGKEIKTFLRSDMESIENCEICLGCRKCCGTFQLSL